MREVVVVSAARTPIGNFGGGLKELNARQLGVIAAKEAIKRANIDPEIIDEAIIGNVLSSGHAQNIARQVAVDSGIGVNKPAFSINIVCGSGLKAISLGAQVIKAGDADVILAGGTESMSNAPYLMTTNRWGAKMGDVNIIDSMTHDGLTDAFNNYHMGITAENVAEKFNVSRQEQDEFALNSQLKAEKAQNEGRFIEEIIPVSIVTRKGEKIVDKDEFIKHDMKIEKLEKLRPAFKKDGTVTAGNASGLNDGASMIILMAKEKAIKLGIEYLGEIVAYSTDGIDPKIMGYAPFTSVNNVLKKAGLKVEDIELAELNEAFAAQSVAVVNDLKINRDIVNVNGGAIALGHPIGASGARILTSLLYEMKRRDVNVGLASLCIGGGMGTSIIVKR